MTSTSEDPPAEMSDWRTVLYYAAEDRHRILNDRGEPIAVIAGQLGSAWLAFLLSRNRTPAYRVTAPTGEALFGFQYKTGDFRSWLKVMNAEGELISRIDRTGGWFRLKAEYVIRDRSGTKIGRIENPRMGIEFVILDSAAKVVARGRRYGESTWLVERESISEEPWPEISAAFFLSITWLRRAPT